MSQCGRENNVLGFIARLFILLNGCLFVQLKYYKCFEVRKRHGLSFVGFKKARRENLCVFVVTE